MAVKVETIEKNKVKLTITLSAESFDKAYRNSSALRLAKERN